MGHGGDYNNVIGAKSNISSILMFLCLSEEIIKKKEKSLLGEHPRNESGPHSKVKVRIR